MRRQTERRNVALASASKIQRRATVTNVAAAAANGIVNNPQGLLPILSLIPSSLILILLLFLIPLPTTIVSRMKART